MKCQEQEGTITDMMTIRWSSRMEAEDMLRWPQINWDKDDNGDRSVSSLISELITSKSNSACLFVCNLFSYEKVSMELYILK